LGLIPAHGVSLIGLRPQKSENQYLGSNLHVSMGLEVKQITNTSEGLVVDLQLPRKAEGDIYLYLINQPKKAYINDQKIPFEEVEKNVYKFSMSFDKQAKLLIQ
jgi:hypothetical protein